MAQPQITGAIYRYKDADSHWVYTNDLESVPAAFSKAVEAFVPEDRGGDRLQETAERVREQAEDALEALPGQAKALGAKSKATARRSLREVGDVMPFVKELDGPSVAVGFALSLVIWVGTSAVRRRGRLLFKLLGLSLVVALILGAYFGWLRKAAGLSESQLSSPAALIQDARGAANQMQQRLRKTERTLRRLEEEHQ